MNYEYQGNFLDNFEVAQRSGIANWFYEAAREGAETPDAIVRRSISRVFDSPALRKLRDVVEADASQALEFAEHVLWRESLSPEEKERFKGESEKVYQHRWMSKQPPTKKQIAYLEASACHIIPANRLEASQLIEKYKGGIRGDV